MGGDKSSISEVKKLHQCEYELRAITCVTYSLKLLFIKCTRAKR